MRKAIGILSILLLGAGLGWGQSVSQLNLGELARKVRAQRAQKDLSSVPYFTNDSLPKKGEISIVGGARGPATAGAAGGGEAAQGEAAAEGEAEECGEACWREKFRAQREKIANAQRELNILEREYQLARTQYYQDPNRAMREQYSANTAGGRELQSLLERIRDKQQQLAELEQEMNQLRNELRRSGGKPGWARPE